MGSTFLWKDALYPGTQQDARGRRFTFTKGDVRQAHTNVSRMLSRGLSIPCVWEHQDVEAGDPDEWKANYARHTFGRVCGSRVDGKGVLWLRHEVYDPEDVRQLQKTKYVSPKVYPSGYFDSLGGTYRGATVAHVAASPTVVQHWQKPFEMSNAKKKNRGVFQLESGRTTWQRPFEMSRRDAIYLSYTPEGATVADDNDDKGGGDTGGAAAGIAAVIDALRETGMNIPDEVTDWDGLVIAIKAGGGKPDDGLDDLDDLDAAPADAASAGSAPMMMSATDRNPAVARQARNWARMERPELHTRIKALFQSGRIDRPTAAKLRRQAEAVDMSFTRDGDAVSPLHKRLAELEKLAPHAAWKPDGRRDGIDLSATRGVGRPATLAGDPDADGVVDFMCAGLPAKK